MDLGLEARERPWNVNLVEDPCARARRLQLDLTRRRNGVHRHLLQTGPAHDQAGSAVDAIINIEETLERPKVRARPGRRRRGSFAGAPAPWRRRTVRRPAPRRDRGERRTGGGPAAGRARRARHSRAILSGTVRARSMHPPSSLQPASRLDPCTGAAAKHGNHGPLRMSWARGLVRPATPPPSRDRSAPRWSAERARRSAKWRLAVLRRMATRSAAPETDPPLATNAART